MTYSKVTDEQRDKQLEKIGNKKENRVAVLGSSEAWPLIHKICLDVVNSGFTAVTSRYRYDTAMNNSHYRRVKQNHDGLKINEFLIQKVIKSCSSAIIVYTPPSTSYNEAEWCNKHNIPTLGINFTRTIHRENYCGDCIVDEGAGFSYCCGEGNTETCATKKPCPFKDSGISKSQLDYFLSKNKKMNLISVEKLNKTAKIIDAFARKKLTLPNKLIHVFQFRVDLCEEEHSKITQKLADLRKENEDVINHVYEYVDHYYKPINTSDREWLTKKHSLRIRQHLGKAKEEQYGSVYYSQVEQTKEGFYHKQPFGGMAWFEGNLDKTEKWLQEIGMQRLLRIHKEGQKAHIPQENISDTKINVFLDKIKVIVDTPVEKEQHYGYSLEIELWTDKPHNMEEIKQKKKKIFEDLSLDIEKCEQKIVPVQEFIYDFIDKEQALSSQIN